MGRSPCCAKEGLNRGAWTAHEDKILTEYIRIHGEGRWRNLPKQAGLKRCGKSCRLRWLNYLRPDIKRGNISSDEEELIVRLHKLLGNRWSLIAGRLPGRTDNEIKNYWNTNLVKRFKDQHHQTNTSSRGLSKQKPNEKNSRNIPKSQVITPKNKSLPSPSSSPSPSPPKLIHTKTTRATKVFINPNLHSTMKFQQKISKTEEQQQEVFPEPLRVDSAVNSISSTNQLETNNYDNEFSTDLLIDFNMGEISLSDLLNSDFSDVCDFSYCNNNSDVDLSSLMFSNEMLQDWTQSNFDESNVGSNDVHSFTSFLESKEELLEE